ncbi:hypothetical protein BT93_F1209 [Corymbia citriodora subsp. variegata]|nr:hypothetical protein BT93_F1209 [Corymbia citriodora subsp. variegata]
MDQKGKKKKSTTKYLSSYDRYDDQQKGPMVTSFEKFLTFSKIWTCLTLQEAGQIVAIALSSDSVPKYLQCHITIQPNVVYDARGLCHDGIDKHMVNVIKLQKFFGLSTAADTLNSGWSIKDGETLVSSGLSFVLGFFSPGNSKNRYFSIWYKITPEIVVWVANRDNPLTDSHGVLTFSRDGDLVLVNQLKSVIWSSNLSMVLENPVAQLLDTGNLVLRESTGLNSDAYPWRSFDHPSDTLLPGEKLGWDLKTVELVSLRSGKKYQSGPWNRIQFSGASVGLTAVTTSVFFYGENEIFFVYEPRTGEFIARVLMMNHSGLLQYYVATNGICRVNRAPICDRFKGFVPKSRKEWDVFIWSGGCTRRIPVNCSKEEGFVKLAKLKLPDLLRVLNCSCTAYANSDIKGGGSGCLRWFGSLIDIKEYEEDNHGQTLYICLPKSELDVLHNSAKKKRMVIAVLMSAFAAFILLAMVYCCRIWNCRIKSKGRTIKKEDDDLPLSDLANIVNATNLFSENSLIGLGGFGQVYKGNLSTGQEVAEKRLSRNSGQALEEFMNETILIAKLQHRNLVGLLGCCMEREERILVYEYMQNKSLDYFIFDREGCLLLDWEKSFDIIIGIARGLLYLHRDSKLQVIHRDLKASNILLDGSLSPRISDFGLAGIFVSDEKEPKTKRIIGTYGYMSPEYAFDEIFSVKSDVFSFSMLLLEIKFPNDTPVMSSVVAMLGNESISLPPPKQPGLSMERSSMDLSATQMHEELHTINVVTVTRLDDR